MQVLDKSVNHIFHFASVCEKMGASRRVTLCEIKSLTDSNGFCLFDLLQPPGNCRF